GMPRHASTHAAGVVITENPVTSYVPVSVNSGVIVTQFDMDTIAELGLLKFDFLALRYLTIINNAEVQIRENNPSFDLTKVDISDSATYDTICAGRCDGVFQLESSGMRQMLTQLRPRCLDDIIAAIALYRPGPMDSIPKYIEARHDKSKIRYCTPKLAPILDVTYGCIVYQEQVMQIFREIAGYSFGHADVVRRAISKKKQGVLDGERQAFIDGAVAQGIDEREAVELFEDIVSFANYAFNKSHAAAYAVLSFRTAYLKTHHPREYESALLTSVMSSTDKLAEYITDCAKQGIRILPPDINKSRGSFHVEGDAIRFGMTAIKSIGSAFIEQIVAERNRNGEYTDFDDFIQRTRPLDMNKRQLETLIKSGSLDCLGVPRSQMLAVYESVLDKKSTAVSDDMDGQIGLFDLGMKISAPKPVRIEFPQLPEFSAREKLMLEKESCGLYLTGHVLDDYKLHLEKIRPAQLAHIHASFKSESADSEEPGTASETPAEVYTDKSRVTVAGCITKRTNKQTKNGEQMAFIQLEDRTSSIEMLCFPKTLAKFGHLLTFDSVIAVTGTISAREDEDVKLLCDRVTALIPDSEADRLNEIQPEPAPQTPKSAAVQSPAPAQKPVTKIFLRVPDENSQEFRRAKAVCGIFDGPVPVYFYSMATKAYLSSGLGIAPTEFVIGELKELLGGENVALR
ncbi:MAG: DNA polymerase III subunit alpha, partial [Clostridia bacterium]|nr:DNA polymerase III subunit alpha [Clostridia bacterium]